MKNFITLLFVIISFNSIFSQIQSVEIYDHINDMNKKVYLDEIDTVYIVLGKEVYDEKTHSLYFDNDPFRSSWYSISKPTITEIEVETEEHFYTEDSFYVVKKQEYKKYIESTDMFFINPQFNDKVENSNIVKVYCKLDSKRNIEMVVLDINEYEYLDYLNSKRFQKVKGKIKEE